MIWLYIVLGILFLVIWTRIVYVRGFWRGVKFQQQSQEYVEERTNSVIQIPLTR